MGMIKEFKEFASKGSVIDLAVGVIIGGAIGKVVSSLVDDVIMPPIGMLMSGVDFSDLSLTLKAAVGEEPAVLIRYGAFLNTVITFLIVAVCIFMLLKVVNGMRKRNETPPAPPAGPTKEEVLLTEIRDALRAK